MNIKNMETSILDFLKDEKYLSISIEMQPIAGIVSILEEQGWRQEDGNGEEILIVDKYIPSGIKNSIVTKNSKKSFSKIDTLVEGQFELHCSTENLKKILPILIYQVILKLPISCMGLLGGNQMYYILWKKSGIISFLISLILIMKRHNIKLHLEVEELLKVGKKKETFGGILVIR